MLLDIEDILFNLEQTLTLHKATQVIVDFKPVDNIITSTEIKAVVQIADPDKILNDKVDFNKRYLQVHCKEAIDNNDKCDYNAVSYKAFLINNYRAGIFDFMGIGKTNQVLSTVSALWSVTRT